MELYCPVIENIPVLYNYNGTKDKDGIKKFYSSHIWTIGNASQEYRGEFFRNSLHGCGKYTWNFENGKSIAYEGQFYANNLEGYGRISYPTGEIFEGLFKNNRRYGPGIFTYVYGAQDVGLWNGRQLLRLSCAMNSRWIPRLADTPSAKVKLLKYKKLVPVCPPNKSKAVEILKESGGKQRVMQQAEELYSNHVRHKDSLFFNKGAHDCEFFGSMDCEIEVVLPAGEGKSLSRLTKSHSSLSQLKVKELDSSEINSEQSYEFVCRNRCSDRYSKWWRSSHYVGSEESSEKDCFRLCEFFPPQEQFEKIDDVLDILENVFHFLRFRKKLIQMRSDEEGEIESITGEEIDEASMYTAVLESLARSVPDLRFSTEKFLMGNDDIEMIKDPMELKEYIRTIDLLSEAAAQLRSALLKERDEKMEKNESKILKPRTKIVQVKELLAWNNQEYIIDMMMHSFLHRKQEETLSYNVSDLLSGNRQKFRLAGEYENDCVSFLRCCSTGDEEGLRRLMSKSVNPDLADSRGNTGVFFASSVDKLAILEILNDTGAGLNVYNNECLTPLNLCICRYLAIRYEVTNWEKAFLSGTVVLPDDLMNLKEWHPQISSRMKRNEETATDDELYDWVSQNSNDNDDMYKFNDFTDVSQTYVLTTDCIKPPKKKQKKEKETSPEQKRKASRKSSKKGSKIFEASKKSESKRELKKIKLEETLQHERERKENNMSRKLSVIRKTFQTLLDLGASPDFGEVPFPPLVLSVFSKDPSLVNSLLQNNADPNIRTLDENMTPLHVVVCLPLSEESLEICNVLLFNKANPNLRTNTLHWYKEKEKVLAKRPPEEQDEGKTPLHILAMRYDFTLDEGRILDKMALTLIAHGADTELLYLGHSPLSLAILRGNTAFIEELLKSQKVNVNQRLGEGMGVPLTVLLLKRYKQVQPSDVTEKILELLMDNNGNPFETVSHFRNAIEFVIQEHELPMEKDAKSSKKSSQSNKTRRSTTTSKSSRSSKTSIKGSKSKTPQKLPIGYFFNSARNFLTKYLKAEAVRNLYMFISEKKSDETFLPYMSYFVTPEEAVALLQLLVHNRRVPVNETTCLAICHDVIEFIKEYSVNKSFKKRASIRNIFSTTSFKKRAGIRNFFSAISLKKRANIRNMSSSISLKKRASIRNMSSSISFKTRASIRTIPSDISTTKLLENFDITKQRYHPDRFFNFPPELDDNQQKYIVCFNCCCKLGKELIVCPYCYLVYFCSEACNKASIKRKTIHRCKLLFYKSEKQRIDNLKSEGLPVVNPVEEKLEEIFDLVLEREATEEVKKKLTKELTLIYGKRGKPKEEVVQKVLAKLERKKKQRMSNLHHHQQYDDKLEEKSYQGSREESKVSFSESSSASSKRTAKVVGSRSSSSEKRKNKYETNYVDKEKVVKEKKKEKNAVKHSKQIQKKNSHKPKKHRSQFSADHFSSPKATLKSQIPAHPTSKSSPRSSANASKSSPRSLANASKSPPRSLANASKSSPRSSANASKSSPLSSRRTTRPPSPQMESASIPVSRFLPDKEFIKFSSVPGEPLRRVEVPFLGEAKSRTSREITDSSRLPLKYQCLLESLSDHLIDRDLPTFILPYACFTGDQLYYRFRVCERKCPTYSEV